MNYITKPFNPMELIARVNSTLRRYMSLGSMKTQSADKDIIEIGGIKINLRSRQVYADGLEVKLTPTQFNILSLLMRNPGRVFSIDEIYEYVWDEPAYSPENTVTVHIRKIRERIEINPKEPRYLKVVWGVGYKIEG